MTGLERDAVMLTIARTKPNSTPREYVVDLGRTVCDVTMVECTFTNSSVFEENGT